MMKIQIASDLHTEFERPEIMAGKPRGGLEKTDSDIIVLAGDVSVGFDDESTFCLNLAQEHGKPVVFVLGNHSFYRRGNVDTIRSQWSAAMLDGVHYLDEGYNFVHEGYLFTGGILWTDFKDYHRAAMSSAERDMNDFRGTVMSVEDSSEENLPIYAHGIDRAKDGYFPEYKFTARRSVDEHYRTKGWIAESLRDSKEEKRIVVSHHAPSFQSVADQFKYGYESNLNPAYYSDLTDWIRDAGNIDLWIHGHMHNSSDYVIEDGPRVICNPRGYAGYDVNPDFNPSMVIEV